MRRPNRMPKPFGLVQQTLSGYIVGADETAIFKKRTRYHEVAKNLASHVTSGNTPSHFSLITNRSEVMAPMAEALANHPIPTEVVVRSRVGGGLNKSVPGACF
jgi:hypothetical protein